MTEEFKKLEDVKRAALLVLEGLGVLAYKGG